MQQSINSKEYWNKRFITDWESNRGREQTAFFYSLVSKMPECLRDEIKINKYSIVDRGCAEGQGGDSLSKLFPESKIIGTDFSKEAIKVARELYPDLLFYEDDLLQPEIEADVVVISNVLEHFKNPWNVLEKQMSKVTKYIVVLVPFREYDLCDEHEYTFAFDNIRILSDSYYLSYVRVFANEEMDKTLWNGQQILLVYKNNAYSNELIDVHSIIDKNIWELCEGEKIMDISNNDFQLKLLEKLDEKNKMHLDHVVENLKESKQEAKDLKLKSDKLKLRNEKVESELRKLQLEGKEIKESFEKLYTERCKIEERIEALKIEKQKKENEMNHDIAEKDEINKKLIEQIELEKNNSYSSIESLQNQINLLSVENSVYHSTKAELEKIHNSTFWRIALQYYKWRHNSAITPVLNLFSKKHGVRNEMKKTDDVEITVSNEYVEDQFSYDVRKVLDSSSNKKIIIFPPLVDWNIPLFQRPQHIARFFGEEEYIYFFGTCNYLDSVETVEEVSKNCYLINIAETINTEKLYSLLSEYKDREIIIHLYSTDNVRTWESVLEFKDRGFKILYEYVDEISDEISGIKIPKSTWDKHYNILSDEDIYVVATARKLYNEVIECRSKNLLLATNGVDYNHFDVKKNNAVVPREIEDVVKKEKPIIGYFGAFAKWFDYKLVKELAKERPNYEILLIGKDYDGTIASEDLDKFDNITVVGPINYKVLPQYGCWFDVATIPFLINDITESTSPIKLFEYMALDVPIVTTAMPECFYYESVLVGKNSKNYIKKIDKALNLKSDKLYMKRLYDDAQSNTWRAKTKDIIKMLES